MAYDTTDHAIDLCFLVETFVDNLVEEYSEAQTQGNPSTLTWSVNKAIALKEQAQGMRYRLEKQLEEYD